MTADSGPETTSSDSAASAGDDVCVDSPRRRVGIIINTPAQVHFYRHVYRQLIERGHKVCILAREETETLDLLREFTLPHSTFCRPSRSQVSKILSLPRDVMTSTAILKKHRVDIVTGFGVYDAFSSALLGIPNVVFIDNEPKIGMRSYEVQFNLFFPFVDCLLTPSYFRGDLGKRHFKVRALKEMAYLHPREFKPDDSVYEALAIDKRDRYSLLRFNGMGAFHDLGVGGFRDEDKVRLVHELEEYGHVFISSEKRIPREIEDRVIRLPKRRIHDAEYFASLLVTDTQTMATEAALLGTPTVRCNSFVGSRDMGNFVELEKQYRLLFNCRDPEEAIARAIELAMNGGAKEEWGQRRKALLGEMIDLTAFMVWYIENHPRSMQELCHDPRVQDRFRCPSGGS